jgi:hypothetical protein
MRNDAPNSPFEVPTKGAPEAAPIGRLLADDGPVFADSSRRVPEEVILATVSDDPVRRAVFKSYEAAIYAGVSEQQLARLRKSGEGPPYLRLTGKDIGYRRDDLDVWIAGHIQQVA